MNASRKTIERLSHYRMVLSRLSGQGVQNIYSRELAALADCTPAQVRRDLMVTGYEGNPKHGYNISELKKSLDVFFDFKGNLVAVIVGAGSLGRALIAYFMPKKAMYDIVAAFDSDTNKTGRLINGTPCFHINEIVEKLQELKPDIALLTVPAESAQEVALKLIKSGVSGILNFAPVRLKVPEKVYVENIDVTMSLEKVAFFSRQYREEKNNG